jgi:elongation factor P
VAPPRFDRARRVAMERVVAGGACGSRGRAVDWVADRAALCGALPLFPVKRSPQGDSVPSTNDLKNGMTLDLDGQLWNVVEFQHVKPGKGGAFVRTTLKNVTTGKVVDRTFNAGVKVEIATVDKREMTYLYREGEDFVFMDTESYEQIYVPAETVGSAADYMLENTNATVALNEGVALYVELPASVELTISYTEPGLQGDRSSGGTKPATLETGASIQVPLFVTNGERVKVDTRDGRYLGRAN